MVYVLSRIKCARKADQKIATHGKTSVFNDVAGDLDARMSKAFADRGVLVILVDLALGPTQLLAEAVDGYAVISIRYPGSVKNGRKSAGPIWSLKHSGQQRKHTEQCYDCHFP